MKTLTYGIIAGTIMITNPAFAQDDTSRADRRAQWESLSTSEKVDLIEKKRAEHIREKNAKWESLSDAEKIKFAEEKRKQGKGKRPQKRQGFRAAE